MTLEKRKYVRLSPATWAEIRALWATGEVTLAELASRFNVTTRTLQAHFDKTGAVKGSKGRELAAAVTAQVYDYAMRDKDDLTSKALQARNSAYLNAVQIENLLMGQLTMLLEYQ